MNDKLPKNKYRVELHITPYEYFGSTPVYGSYIKTTYDKDPYNFKDFETREEAERFASEVILAHEEATPEQKQRWNKGIKV